MKHEAKDCPRCGREFECKSGSIDQCQCSQLHVSTEALEYVMRLYDDCLCATCLAVLSREAELERDEAPVVEYSS